MAHDPSLISLYSYDSGNYPNNLKALSLDGSTIRLSWFPPTGNISQYKIYQSYTNDLEYRNVGITSGLNFVVSGLETKRDYYFFINSILSGNVDNYSGSYKPLNPTVRYQSPNLVISWLAPSGVIVSGYRIWRTENFSEALKSVGSTKSLSYIESGLENTKNYYYRITSLF